MDAVIVTLIDYTIVPVTGTIPFLAEHGILLLVFAALWAGFAVAFFRNRANLDLAWTRLRRLPLVAQGAAWLLFLPVLAGLWIWRRSWPMAARVTVIAALAGWNLLIFLPQAA